jgi:hypothetical protein
LADAYQKFCNFYLIQIGIIILFFISILLLITFNFKLKFSIINIIISLYHENSINELLLSSLPLINTCKNSRSLTTKEKEAFSLNSNLKEILVRLLLGDILFRFRNGKNKFNF